MDMQKYRYESVEFSNTEDLGSWFSEIGERGGKIIDIRAFEKYKCYIIEYPVNTQNATSAAKCTREELVEIISAIALESEKLSDLLFPREPYSLRFSFCGAHRVISALEQAGALQVKE